MGHCIERSVDIDGRDIDMLALGTQTPICQDADFAGAFPDDISDRCSAKMLSHGVSASALCIAIDINIINS